MLPKELAALSTYLTAGEANSDNSQVIGVGEETARASLVVHCEG